MARLTVGMNRYVEALKAAAPGVPIYVTSGERTPEEQADAMLKKLQLGGSAELYKTYQDDRAIASLLTVPPSTAAWADAIRRLAATGTTISRHLFGRAIDLRTKDLSASQIDTLKRAVAATGGRYLLESTPPHLHVDMPAAYVLASAVETSATIGVTKVLPWVLGIGAGVIGLVALRDWLAKRGKTSTTTS
jgi:hypothetical protein